MARPPPPSRPQGSSRPPQGPRKPGGSAPPRDGQRPPRDGQRPSGPPRRTEYQDHARPDRPPRPERPNMQRDRTAAPLPSHVPTWPGVVSLVLRPGTATPVLAGHPWIFSGAIAHVVPAPGEGSPTPGQACAVFDPHARFLGHGYCNLNSQIAIRVVEAGLDGLEPERIPSARELLQVRLARAAKLRRDLQLPSAETDAFRLVNSEGDQLPGLTIDRYADGAVVQASTAGASRWLPDVVDLLRKEHGCAWVLTRVPQDVHPAEGLEGGNAQMHGEVPVQVQVRHNGLTLRVEPAGGQKTGMYVDQRENHVRAAKLAKGRFVLDTFSHAGGFGLHAARAGAAKVVCVDASQRAVDLAMQHAEDNDLHLEALAADAVHILRNYADLPPEDQTGRPSLVIVDPPKLASRAGALDQALKKYTHINTLAMQAVAEDGFLVTCSCSGLVDRQAFLRMLGQAAHNAGRSVQLLALDGAGADHPVAPAHPEGQYLKVAFCRVTGRGA
jgi:23S rRNA (cytosine1962-C5)-methyltransferase